MESIDWCLVSAWAAIPLHVKKLAVMVNGTTCAKKLRWNIRNGNRNIDIYIALLQTIDIESNMKILIYNNTVICQYGNIDINKDIGCRTLSEWSYRPCGRDRK